MSSTGELEGATRQTAENLEAVARTLAEKRLTKLSLPEIDSVIDLVADVIPAGNVPGMILSGLTRISGNHIQPQKARQDINILFNEVSVLFEQAKFGAVFGGPAAIIWGYQNLLRLAGKDPESAFPEGVWQFYVDYALREDTARHTNETHGFDTLLNQNHIKLSDVDRLTAWVMASVMCLHQYNSLLGGEWYERTALWLLQEASERGHLFSEWDRQKPYVRATDAAAYDYPTYRRLKFDEFLAGYLDPLPHRVRAEWENKLKSSIEYAQATYQKQLTILAYLEPGPYGETRVPISMEQACIGVIHKGVYYLLPVCEPGTSKPLDVRTARSQIVRLMSMPPREPAKLQTLARVKRADFAALRKRLNLKVQDSLARLKYAPILINTDRRDPSMLLSEIRQGERGIGDHALTIFETGKAFAFDQSHIFFDGTWGAALAEILTNEALSWAAYLNLLSPAVPAQTQIFTRLDFPLDAVEQHWLEQAHHVAPEAGAENNQINIQACLRLKHYFQQRSDLLKLTINDLLVLYRAIHAATYQPSTSLRQELNKLERTNPEAARRAWQAVIESANRNPSILIPVDASKRIPRDRVYPMNMEVPLAELGLLDLHREALELLSTLDTPVGDEKARKALFDQLQRRYLATLGGFGTILAKAKSIAVQGESASVGAIKLLAHLPLPVKYLLDNIPARYAKLNNLLKGTEVLSNLGAVAKSSSLTRFITAKDDNDQKELIWGMMTDSQGVMNISLRDFRPYVRALQQIGRMDLACMIAQDYLDQYVQGFNQFVREVTRISLARPLSDKR